MKNYIDGSILTDMQFMYDPISDIMVLIFRCNFCQSGLLYHAFPILELFLNSKKSFKI